MTYIGLINKYFIKLNSEDPNSNDLSKINKLYNFCQKKEISIIFYSPIEKIFYRKINNNYESSEFEIFENKHKMHLDSSDVDFYKFFKFNVDHYISETQDNLKFLNRKRELKENFEIKYKNYSISSKEISDFLEKYLYNPKILSFIEVKDNTIIPNIQEDNYILLGLNIHENKLSIKYLIYHDDIYDVTNFNISKGEDIRVYIYVLATSFKNKLMNILGMNE